MEIELKFKLPEDGECILNDRYVEKLACGTVKETYMDSVYYDTCDSILNTQGITLRLRYEGGTPSAGSAPTDYVCTMKRGGNEGGALSHREEYQCSATDIYMGLEGLINAGADEKLLRMCGNMELISVAEVGFVRKSLMLCSENTKIELAIDCGSFADKAAFHELELELIDGDEKILCALGEYLMEKYGLTPENESKYVRAYRAFH